ncbi:uncharacterized protein [Venturia canescens]|uniref:uncharacterized protein isoform X2 n=1 Tax=Venturia canescens TaxID=32260 RepID=UPI001C9D06C5|nr:uncharacterized protein LOC122409573 isoform X2 [Venturia canescens]
MELLDEPAEMRRCDLERSDRLRESVEEATERKLRLLLREARDLPAAEESDFLETKLPSYYDPLKFQLGQRVFDSNVFTMMIGKLAGLLTLLAVPSILAILKFTKQSGTPCTAFRRYASTILHTCVWYKNSPEQRVEFFESLKNVRKKHCIASRRSFEAGVGKITQLDMALTQFGFMGFPLLCDKRLGIVTTEEELEGLIHFWRVIGRMLGIEERFNICNGSVEETRALCRRLLEDIFLPHLAKPSEDFDEMGRVLLEGLWPVNPFIDNDAFRAFTIDLVTSAVPNNNHPLMIGTRTMSRYSRFVLNLQLFVHEYLIAATYRWSFVFRAIFNAQMRMGIFLTERFPFLAYWLFGRSNSCVNIYKFHFD